jgi:hypothetical protein
MFGIGKSIFEGALHPEQVVKVFEELLVLIAIDTLPYSPWKGGHKFPPDIWSRTISGSPP